MRLRYVAAALVVAALFWAGLWGLISDAQAQEPGTSQNRILYDLLEDLNGTPVSVGSMVVTDAGVATMTGTPWRAHVIQCNAPAHVGVGTTCSDQYDAEAYCLWQNANERAYLIPTSRSDAGLAVRPADGGTAVKCAVLRLQ